MGFSLKQLEELKAAGKIQGYTESVKKYSTKSRKNIPGKKGSKNTDWLKLHLVAWCGAHKLNLEEELKFHPERKWRFDFAIPELMVAIEYEGLGFKKTGHTTSEGFTANTEKYNAGAGLGWKIYRYTYKNYKNVLNDLMKLI